MGWMRIAGFVVVLGLVAACNLDATTPNQCQTDDQCREGAYCDVGRALCVLACEKVGCLEGHFCDPDSHFCKDYCPHACPDRPANATLMCGDVCVYACIDGFRECEVRKGECLSDSSDPTACGPSCESLQVCRVPEYGTATCNDGVCDSTCNAGFYDNAGSCELCTQPQHCGAKCEQCSTADANADSTCESGACSSKCKTGFRPSGTGCVACPDGDCSAIQPVTKTTYNNTELIWQACAAGYIGNECLTATGTAKEMGWEAAKEYCANSTWHGYHDWRLPTQPSTELAAGELGSIVVLPCPSPVTQGKACIDNNAFPNTPPASFFWSSSDANAGDPSDAWLVDFGNGSADSYGKSLPNYVRCVRSGP